MKNAGAHPSELSVFVDESGSPEHSDDDFYLVTLVFHDQKNSLTEAIRTYELKLVERGLPSDIVFHAGPLRRGEGVYADLDYKTRRGLLLTFAAFARRAPVSYRTFAYKRSEYPDRAQLGARLEQDLKAFLLDHLAMFQSFDYVKLYYDDGQSLVKKALRSAFTECISSQALIFRTPAYASYRLLQIADYMCDIELADQKRLTAKLRKSDRIFYGESPRRFKDNFLKDVRSKRLA